MGQFRGGTSNPGGNERGLANCQISTFGGVGANKMNVDIGFVLYSD